jgi:putative oxidoreductase
MSTITSPDTHLEPHAPAFGTHGLGRLFATASDLGPTIGRLALGIVMFPHGAQKMLGWFGGPGYGSTMTMFTSNGVPAVLALLAILAEFLGAMGLVVGAIARVAAFGIACNMVVAILTVNGKNGFFMNWFGQKQAEGFEYHLLALALALIVIVKGAGRFSIDRLLTRRAR